MPGFIGLDELDRYQKRAQIILFINDAARKKKVIYEPLKMLLQQAFEILGLERLGIKIWDSDNQTETTSLVVEIIPQDEGQGSDVPGDIQLKTIGSTIPISLSSEFVEDSFNNRKVINK